MNLLATQLIVLFPRLIAIVDDPIGLGMTQWMDLIVCGLRGEITINVSSANGEYAVFVNDHHEPIAVFWSSVALFLFLRALVPIVQNEINRPLVRQIATTVVEIQMVLP